MSCESSPPCDDDSSVRLSKANSSGQEVQEVLQTSAPPCVAPCVLLHPGRLQTGSQAGSQGGRQAGRQAGKQEPRQTHIHPASPRHQHLSHFVFLNSAPLRRQSLFMVSWFLSLFLSHVLSCVDHCTGVTQICGSSFWRDVESLCRAGDGVGRLRCAAAARWLLKGSVSGGAGNEQWAGSDQ